MRSLLLILLALFAVGCASTSGRGTGFTKVRDYHLQETPRWLDENAGDPMIPFERKYHLYGAVTEEEQRQRWGHYYHFFWADVPGAGPVTFRFDYRQASTGDRVHRLERHYAEPAPRNRTEVQVVGESYLQQGRVVAWRASLSRGGEEVASRQSFLW